MGGVIQGHSILTDTASSLSSSGYIVLNNGLQICWGTASGGTSKTNWPHPFKSSNIQVACCSEAQTSVYANISATGIDANGATFRFGNGGGQGGVRYIAIGY